VLIPALDAGDEGSAFEENSKPFLTEKGLFLNKILGGT